MGLFAGFRVETVSFDRFSGVVGSSTPSTVMFECFIVSPHSVTPKNDRIFELIVALFVQ